MRHIQQLGLTIPLCSMCNTGLCPGPCPYGLGWSCGQNLTGRTRTHARTHIINDLHYQFSWEILYLFNWDGLYLGNWWGSRAGRCRCRWSHRLLQFRLRCWQCIGTWREKRKCHKQEVLDKISSGKSKRDFHSTNRKNFNTKKLKMCAIALMLMGGIYLFGSACSCLLAHPVPSLGTSEMRGSLPLFSAFRLGRLAGGGIRRAEATLPRDCRPWRGGTYMGRRKESLAQMDDWNLRPIKSSGAGRLLMTGMALARYTIRMLNNQQG